MQSDQAIQFDPSQHLAQTEQGDDAMRCDIYLLLATLLRDVPSAPLIEFLADLQSEANETPMAKAWQSLSAAARAVERPDLEQEYQQLFIGIGRGEVVPFASWHLTGSLMEKPLAEIRFHLSQIGLEREEAVKEPEDHISALCETMAYLIETRDAVQKAFFNRHIATWYNKLVDQMNQAEHAQFYRAVAELLGAFLTLEHVSLTQAPSSRKNTHKIEVKNLTDKAEQQS